MLSGWAGNWRGDTIDANMRVSKIQIKIHNTAISVKAKSA
jgi:hypothetical protein